MTNDVLASCVDEQRVFLLYEHKLKLQRTSLIKLVIHS